MSGSRKGASIYLAATVVAMGSALVRYTIMARMLGPEQLGLASMLILTGSFFDSISDSGGDRFLIQDRDGDNPQVQGLVHTILVGRGVLILLALLALAHPIANFYHSPQLGWALMVMGVAPLVSGFVHTDTARRQRFSDFRGESLTVLISETLSTVATGVAAYFTHDFTAILYGLILRSVAYVVVTHLWAERPYRLSWAGDQALRVALFALPLIINGLTLFLGGSGDRILVGERLGNAQLGEYSAVTLLAFYPVMTVGKFLGGLHLPPVASARDDDEAHGKAVDLLAGQTTLLSVIMLVGFVVVAPLTLKILFGPKFAQPGITIGWVAVLQTIRFMRLWPTTMGLAHGRSSVVMITNIVRLVGFPAALIGYKWFGGVGGVIMGFVLGELIAMVTGLAMLNHHELARWHGYDRVGLFTLACAAVIVSEHVFTANGFSPATFAAGAFSIGIVAIVIFRERRTLQIGVIEARRLLNKHRSRAMTP